MKILITEEFISKDELLTLAEEISKTGYGQYLKNRVLNGN